MGFFSFLLLSSPKNTSMNGRYERISKNIPMKNTRSKKPFGKFPKERAHLIAREALEGISLSSFSSLQSYRHSGPLKMPNTDCLKKGRALKGA